MRIVSRAVAGVLAAVTLAALIASAPAMPAAPGLTLPSAAWLGEQVKILAAADTEGRAAGTPGAERAARHIASVFQAAGLAPGGDGSTYLQSFSVPTGVRLGAGSAFDVTDPGRRALAIGRDWTPLAVSADGRAAGDVVFAGYGITAPQLGYDDYARLDARDKVVLVLRGEPRGDDPSSPFRQPAAYHYSEPSHKIINAREHGARAVIVVAHPRAAAEALPALAGTSQPLGIVAVAATRAVADALLAPLGRRLADLAAAIDGTLLPGSTAVPLARVDIAVRLERDRAPTANVVGVLAGADARLAGEAVVIGAHYDHLGRGGEGSLAPEQTGVVHPGADDNASGTAAVMALARAFAAAPRLPRTLVFAAFSGEELGLLGSSHFVRAPLPGGAAPVFMLNLDMVGRLRAGLVHVGGADSAAPLRGWIADAARGLPLTPEVRGDAIGPSDHASFALASVPVLFLFTGAHADYHRPSDTADKIDAAGLETITAFAARIVEAAAGAAARPVVARLSSPGDEPRRSYGPAFGVVPDMGEAKGAGARIAGVRPDSPAERAGVRPGDVVVRFAGVTVKTLEDLTFALRGQRPGDRVEVVVVRDGREHRMDAVLEERK